MFFKIGVLKNFANFSGKHLRSPFLIKLACYFIKKSFQHRCFPVKFANLFRTAFFTEQLRWLLLIMLSVMKLLQHVVIDFALFCQPVNRNQIFSIFKHVHEQLYEKGNWSIRHKWRKDWGLIVLKLKDWSLIIQKLVL